MTNASLGKKKSYTTKDNKFKVQMGVTDDWLHPESVYVVLRSWVVAKDENQRSDTLNCIKELDRFLTRHFRQNKDVVFSDNIFEDDYILDFRYPEHTNYSSAKMNIHVEFNLYPITENNLPFTKHKKFSGKALDDYCKDFVGYVLNLKSFGEDSKLEFNAKR